MEGEKVCSFILCIFIKCLLWNVLVFLILGHNVYTVSALIEFMSLRKIGKKQTYSMVVGCKVLRRMAKHRRRKETDGIGWNCDLLMDLMYIMRK